MLKWYCLASLNRRTLTSAAEWSFGFPSPGCLACDLVFSLWISGLNVDIYQMKYLCWSIRGNIPLGTHWLNQRCFHFILMNLCQTNVELTLNCAQWDMSRLDRKAAIVLTSPSLFLAAELFTSVSQYVISNILFTGFDLLCIRMSWTTGSVFAVVIMLRGITEPDVEDSFYSVYAFLQVDVKFIHSWFIYPHLYSLNN